MYTRLPNPLEQSGMSPTKSKPSRLLPLLVAVFMVTSGRKFFTMSTPDKSLTVASQVQSCLPCSMTSLRYDAEHDSIDKKTCPEFEAIPTLQWSSISSYLFSEDYPHDYFWLAYTGDSLLRASFYGWSNILQGEEWEQRNNRTSRHLDRMFCCRVNPQDGRPWGCKYRTNWNSGELTEAVQAFVMPNNTEKISFAPGTKSFCLTMQWLPKPTDWFVQRFQRLLEAPYPPQAIALNPGLHALLPSDFTDYAKSMDDLIRLIANERRKKTSGPRIILHDTAAVVEKYVRVRPGKEGLTNERIEKWNRIVRQSIRAHQQGIERRILVRIPTYKFSKGSQVIGLHDGTHYEGNFSVILANTDFGMAVGPWTDGFCDLMVPTEENDGDNIDDIEATVVDQ